MRQALARFLARLPWIGPRYTRGMLRAIERTPKEKLTPELRQMQAMLARIPEEQRVELVRAAMRGEMPEPETMPRSMRRAAARESKRKA